MKFYFFILVLVSLDLGAQTLCQRIEGGISNYLENPSSRISFKNRGGLFNGGVCWWHSRLQRSSAYLLEFDPEAPAPTSEQATKLLKQLKSMKSIVTIPGFKDFNTFSKMYVTEVQNLLENWQKEDGFINQQWVRGISGRSELSPEEMMERMNTLFEQFENSPHPLWIMAQIKGVTSHAFLILDMTPSANGYDLRVIDSNHPLETRVLNFEKGQKFLKHIKETYSFVPYSGFQKDLQNIQSVTTRYCNLQHFEVPAGDI